MSLPPFPSSPTVSPTLAMSTLAVPSSPTPASARSSRSERLLRDTLRKDANLRSNAVRASSRSRSATSDCDDEDDGDFFQSAILFRCSSRRNSATSALGHGHPPGVYIPDENEHASYSQLLRSSSYSGSSRSARSERKVPRRAQEKPEDPYHDPAPHEAVLQNRPDTLLHAMREVRLEKEISSVEVLTHTQSSIASLHSSLGSLSNSRTQSNESDQTHITAPDVDSYFPSTPPPKRSSAMSHRHTQSSSVSRGQPITSPHRPSSPPQVLQRSPHSPRSPRSLPQTPRSTEKELLQRQYPDSPWMLTPLPPSPPAFSTSPPKRTGPTVATVVSNHRPHTTESHAHLPARSPGRHSRPSSSFDPDAASHALRELPGYVSFASVAGLGAPPEEEERRTARKPFVGFNLGGGKGRTGGLGLGGGKWWMF